jgi:hypothetical protein
MTTDLSARVQRGDGATEVFIIGRVAAAHRLRGMYA